MKMFRLRDMLMIAIIVYAVGYTYTAKHRTDTTLEEIASVEREIQRRKNAIEILETDWSLMTQPHRLQAHLETFKSQLPLEPLRPDQYARVEQLPPRPLDNTSEEGLDEALAILGRDNLSHDALMTGSIPQEAGQ
ncbi:hypothetical protein [Notoacmeibacter sp. MSK16QG-6]|uniref:cell division protein FtsL n=1 Tax=Notoacmeibacter sp. MSK16QG-6 TaxID=2957982 RepID=UPI0020A1B3ED|nr:hypothetical protein [Notoacmeibacter sp. MSK16QG-6]MCP1199709.1 hypothetical protein [Notoacmeibacter sp. MSK16QG-6]